MSPLVSVVIPVFNRSEELRRAIEALARQTVQGFEVIVCDDGSTEDIPAVLSQFVRSMSIVYCRIPNSGGPARPHNIGIGAARGEWIAMLDSDDWWDDNRMEIVSTQLRSGIDVLYHPLRVVRARGLESSSERRNLVGEPMRGDALKHLVMFGNPIPNSSVLVRKSKLLSVGGIVEDPELVAVEDFDAWLRLAEAGAHFCFLDQVLGSYWIGSDGISAFSMRQITRLTAVFERHVDRFDPAYRAQARSCQEYRLGAMQLQLGQDLGAAYAHLLRAGRLPTASMRAKRIIKLAQARLRIALAAP